mgnify:CR=1 FL=1
MAMVAEVDTAAAHATALQTSRVELHNSRKAMAMPPTHVTARTEAPVLDDELAEHLPDSYRERQEYHPHESPWTMTVPLMVLALLAAAGGGLNLPFASDLHFLQHWLEPSLFGHEVHVTASASTKWVLAVIAVLGGLAAIVASFRVYMAGAVDPATIEAEGAARAWYLDETYAGFFGGPGRAFFNALASFDRNVIDGAVRGVARGTAAMGQSMRALQPGFVRSYALGIGLGSVLVMVWFLGRLFV